MLSIPWRVGFEIELLLPPGKSRADMARQLAARAQGRARRCFHLQSEPSAVPGMEVFHNLTLGFVVEDGSGCWLAKCLDDLTLQSDLIKAAPPRPDWYRIVSDDPRILRLIEQQSDPSAVMEDVLKPVAELFGGELLSGPQGMRKVCDRAGESVAMVCSLPGERERPCELVTAPWEAEQEAKLQELLEVAQELGCLVPAEGASHIHFDGSALRQALTVANLVNLLNSFSPLLKTLWQTNARCTRLGSWPAELSTLVNGTGFSSLCWAEARCQLQRVGLSKFCDFNLLNLLRDDSFCTVELRILPSGLQAGPIVRAGRMFAALLRRACSPEPILPADESAELEVLLAILSLESEDVDYWRQRVVGGHR